MNAEWIERGQRSVLAIAAMMCATDIFLAPRGADPGPWVVGVLAVLLARRMVLAWPQPALAVGGGVVLTAIALAGDHGFLNINRPAWMGAIVVAGCSFAFAEKIEKLKIRRMGQK